MTQVFGSFLAISGAAVAGTTGTGEAEQARLQDEVTAARNALDALVLQKGMKLDDPRVKEKSAALEEKLKAFRQGFQESQKRAPPPTTYPRSPEPANGERDEPDEPGSLSSKTPIGVSAPAGAPSSPRSSPKDSAPASPETVLSGEGVKKEIAYEKKTAKPEKPVPKLSPRVEAAEEPLPADTNTPDASGLSEIQYSKKKKPTESK